MLDVDTPLLFLQVDEESENRMLHPGKIVGVGDHTYTCEFDPEEVPSCEEGGAAFIYFEGGRTFMQQTARICSVAEAESKLLITLETTSAPVSAESRECYRVSTIMLGLTVSVADEEDCPLIDVSVSGMSATTASSHQLGDEVAVTLSYDGREYTGKVTVHSVRGPDGGRIRYGFHCVENRRSGGTLQQGLQAVSTSVQRLLIKRMART